MHILILMILLNLFSYSSIVFANEHQLFTELLSDHVNQGLVDYKKLCKDKRLKQYAKYLSAMNPDQLESKNHQLAYWINTYNANTLKVVCDDYPIKSMNELNFGGLLVSVALKKTVWDRKFIEVNSKKISLKSIEHDIIRPRFLEPRSHLALSCGAISCPPLSSTAYEGEMLDAQLTQQAERFFGSKFYNEFDTSKKEARLSPILNWNERYFGNSSQEVLLFASQFFGEDVARQISGNVNKWKVRYNKYELRLNDEIN